MSIIPRLNFKFNTQTLQIFTCFALIPYISKLFPKFSQKCTPLPCTLYFFLLHYMYSITQSPKSNITNYVIFSRDRMLHRSGHRASTGAMFYVTTLQI